MPSSQSQHQVQNRPSRYFIVSSCFLVVHLEILYVQGKNYLTSLYLLPREDKSLLRWRNSFFFFDSFLDPLHAVSGLNVNLYFLASESFDFYEHVEVQQILNQ